MKICLQIFRMNISSIKNKLQYQQYCNKIIEQKKISKQGFYDLTILEKITKNKSHRWYCYIKYIQLILKNFRNKREFFDQKQIYKFIKNKYEYWKKYQQDISDIQIKIVIKKNFQIQILGHYFNQEKFIQQFVCIYRLQKNTEYKIINQNQLRDLLFKNKMQIKKQEEKIIYLNKEKIEQYINNY